MEYQRPEYVVYVRINASGYITAVNSSAFLIDSSEWVEIDSGYGNKYGHAQSQYFNQPIYTIGGACRYKLVDGKPVECTADEIAQQEKLNIPESKPSQLDIIEAQVAYTAMMTDTLLEV